MQGELALPPAPRPLARQGKPGEWWPLHEPGAEVKSWFRWDGKSPRFEIKHEQDVGDLLAWNRKLAAEGNGYSPRRTLRRAASIPAVIGMKWLREEGWAWWKPENRKRLLARLNDPDWRWLRTAPGWL